MNSSKDRPEEGSGRTEEFRDENATAESTEVPGVDLNKVVISKEERDGRRVGRETHCTVVRES